ncbi:beta-lactamase family protein [Planosporangium flavigriseum]|uniref:Penicillin-binding protein n=1 Tax=Planosporangium flavigriseum TaxID=373681 RepID=A0A8J3LR94_9ACTN|nr:serine hydrolase domain-containing protein [Planosporangium flavigriseum]NJC63534.1 beta-lactamase family protein [Planosporangium flavigriseum]GIG72231.1 penicillin-binding protein [Planosporangium flavigriseum]
MAVDPPTDVQIAAAAAVAESFQHAGGQPGIAYGIVANGELVHSGGIGERRLGGPEPDADTVFRIASMTKSFTASAVLLLRDRGTLRLDDTVESYVPELDGLKGPTADSPTLTIRHLLTMAGGFPTDDPWGDRQQGLSLPAFSDLLRGGLSFAWAPGTRFEYSNLGYAILGRVIAAAAGSEYLDFMTNELIKPVGLERTVFDPAGLPETEVARGYRKVDERWSEVPFDPYGAFAPMGGLFSTVRDLARWVAGMLDAFPARDDSDDAHPLRRASRRELQQPHHGFSRLADASAFDELSKLTWRSYGYGLMVDEDARHGRFVGHSGGYPGFGSHMRWHPQSGIGVVALGNSTYAAARTLAADMLDALLEGRAVRPSGPAPHGRPASAATLEAKADIERLLTRWDDDVAARWFAVNVDLDEPIARRRAEIERIREQLGDLRPADGPEPEHDSPAHCAWWLRGPNGRLRVEIRLTPETPPRVQTLNLTVAMRPNEGLRAIVDKILAALNDPSPAFPPSVATAPSADRHRLDRMMRLAGAWAGTCRHAEVWGGDGETATTIRITGESGDLMLTLQTDQENVLVQKVAVEVAI